MKPQAVSDVLLAFPADVEVLMPSREDIPEEYWNYNDSWHCQLFSDMFFNGVRDLVLMPKDGIDPELAFRHIKAIMRSFQPKHEHKTAACCYLLDQWFETATWNVVK
jgi:hypothetical protein